jgi:glycosyltransferase involved in cell wall biosynthesis
MTSTGDTEIELSIVIPCLNEAETLGTCIKKAQSSIKEHDLRAEIIIGDNGSKDGSQDIAESLGARVVKVKQKGYGAALYNATRTARGRYILMGDADDSYDFQKLYPFVEKLRGGCDLVMGNRFQGGIRKGAMPWKNRYIGNPVLSGVGRILFRSPIGDFHCGMRGFSRSAFERMNLRTTGMEYASEMVIKATLQRMQIGEVPTTLSKDGRSRPPHLRPWRDGWRHLRFMLLYSPRWLFFYPGILLTLIGALITAWLLPGPQAAFGIGFDFHTLLFGAGFILIGCQSISFAIFAKIYANSLNLLPRDGRLDILKRFKLEYGLVAGSLFILLGLIGSAQAVANWFSAPLLNLTGSETLRLSIASVLGLVLGAQTILNSFMLSVTQLKTRSAHEKRIAAN